MKKTFFYSSSVEHCSYFSVMAERDIKSAATEAVKQLACTAMKPEQLQVVAGT